MTRNQKAIIIGGGIAGKLAARVLADFFQEVVVLERDEEPRGPVARGGARQGEHLHALLHAGQYGLEELFPGITAAFSTSGALQINSTKDLAWYHHGVWKARFDAGYTTTLQTRPHLEWHIEKFVKQLPNVSIYYHQVVQAFEYSNEEHRIIGVKCKDLNNNIRTLNADVVVDASGAGSVTTNWLQHLGINIPTETVTIGLKYFSAFYKLPENNSRDWKVKLVYPTPPQEKIGGSISKVEGDRYIVTLMSYENALDEKDVLGSADRFLEVAKKLPKADIYHELKDATRLSETKVYRVPQISWRRFDQAKQLPKGLLLLGDTVCRIDPVFGQGMSIAVLEALALQKLLQQGSLDRTTVLFPKKTAKIIAPIWNMVVAEDYRYPGIVGKKPVGLGLQQRFAKNIFLLSGEHTDVYHAFIHVMNLTKPVTSMLKPSLLKKF